jgi:hypothetical protein
MSSLLYRFDSCDGSVVFDKFDFWKCGLGCSDGEGGDSSILSKRCCQSVVK